MSNIPSPNTNGWGVEKELLEAERIRARGAYGNQAWRKGKLNMGS